MRNQETNPIHADWPGTMAAPPSTRISRQAIRQTEFLPIFGDATMQTNGTRRFHIAQDIVAPPLSA